MRTLLIEDDPKLGPTLAKLLRGQSYGCDLEKTGQGGLTKALDSSYDIILLDLNLPDCDGMDVCKELRVQKVNTPILMLTARDKMTDKIYGLDNGADDYMPKPFNTGELFARMRTLLRRPQTVLPTVLEFADIALNPATHSVFHAKKEVELMPKEFALLEYLMRNSDRAVSREELLRHVWGVYSNSSSNRLEVYVRYLRGKIDRPFKTNYLKTVRGVGYKLANS